MSLGDLSQDIMGTSPKYPKIVNHGWLDVDKANYDNYPSDNNPVRVVPKLSEFWNHEADKGPSIVPNNRVLPMGLRSSESKESAKAVQEVVKEAKKAIMAGKIGRDLASHLRTLFVPVQLEAAKEELQKLSDEQGLLGNVYVDASAFSSYNEAKQFLNQHRNRLARDMVIAGSEVQRSALEMLASDFRKNVITAVDYSESLFKKYKDHLVIAGRIPANFEIDSKESLRAAFLYEKPQIEKAEKAPEKVLEASVAAEELVKMAENKQEVHSSVEEALVLRKVHPILSFAQEVLSRGKEIEDLKEMLRKKFAMCDLMEASPYLSLIAVNGGLSPTDIIERIAKGDLSEEAGTVLQKIANQYPIKKTDFDSVSKTAHSVGVQARFYALSNRTNIENLDEYRKAALEALQKGFDLPKIKDKLVVRMSSEEADKVIADAVSLMNSSPAGSVANKAVKPVKEALFEEPQPKENPAHNPDNIMKDYKEVVDIFAGSNSGNIEIDPLPQRKGDLEIQEMFNREGLDSAISAELS